MENNNNWSKINDELSELINKFQNKATEDNALEDLKTSFKERGRVASLSNLNFMTFTNKGYVEYTKNLIVSNISNNVNASIRVYALDQYSYDYFQDFHDDVVFHKKQDFENSYLSQSDKNFGNLMM